MIVGHWIILTNIIEESTLITHKEMLVLWWLGVKVIWKVKERFNINKPKNSHRIGDHHILNAQLLIMRISQMFLCL